MHKSLPNGWEDSLIWCPELEMGFHPRKPMSYEHDYWQKYLVMDNTPLGDALTAARKDLVTFYHSGDICDIGIGGGKFVDSMGAKGFGFDVNEDAINWLMENNRLVDPYANFVDAISCWDSLEHIPCPENLINQVKQWVFVSLPIFDNPNTITKSKHYRPGEHIWYWSDSGLIKWFDRLGFALVEKNNMETLLGREAISTYVFRRE
jgi:Methyltransferase domain